MGLMKRSELTEEELSAGESTGLEKKTSPSEKKAATTKTTTKGGTMKATDKKAKAGHEKKGAEKKATEKKGAEKKGTEKKAVKKDEGRPGPKSGYQIKDVDKYPNTKFLFDDMYSKNKKLTFEQYAKAVAQWFPDKKKVGKASFDRKVKRFQRQGFNSKRWLNGKKEAKKS